MLFMLKLITFDVTGTILKFKIPVGHQYAKVGSCFGVHIHPDILTNNFKVGFKKMMVEHPNFGSNDIGWENWWGKLVEHTFLDSLPKGVSIETNILNKISSNLIEVYKTKECWELAEGAECLLDTLICKNIKVGVISNYDPRIHDILKDLNIDKYFKFVVSSYSVKCEKPDPEIFKIVEEMNHGVKKEEILHIGDNPKLDFAGAKNAGWNAILIDENVTLNSNIDKEWVVKSLGDVYKTLQKKNML